MVFLGIVLKTRLKYSKELLTIMLKIQKLTLLIIRVTMGHGVIKNNLSNELEFLKTFKRGSFLISEGILFPQRILIEYLPTSKPPMLVR